jgi:tripartite-type tricarboxylate transporter receptor subunit TctC
MKSAIFRIAATVATFNAFALFAVSAQAQSAAAYPSKPITMIVSAASGGVVSITARGVQQPMSEVLGQPIVVEDRPGAGGHIGNALVAKAQPDGYTILASAGAVLLSGVYRNLPYDPIRDLIPIGMVASSGFILVVPGNSRFKTLQDLIAYARANPGKLNFASTSTGNSTHIGAEMLGMMTNSKMTHIPYKGSVGALTDVIGGRVDFLIDNKASSLPHIKSGAVRALGVTAPKRSADLPNVPAIGEIVPGYQIEGWTGLFAPKGTDKAVIDKLTAALKSALSNPAIAQKVSELVGEARYMAPAELAQFMQQDHARLSKVVNAANITVD